MSQSGIFTITVHSQDHHSPALCIIVDLRLWGRYSLFKIMFDGTIIVLANKSITMCNFSLLSVSVIISSLNDY